MHFQFCYWPLRFGTDVPQAHWTQDQWLKEGWGECREYIMMCIGKGPLSGPSSIQLDKYLMTSHYGSTPPGDASRLPSRATLNDKTRLAHMEQWNIWLDSKMNGIIKVIKWIFNKSCQIIRFRAIHVQSHLQKKKKYDD